MNSAGISAAATERAAQELAVLLERKRVDEPDADVVTTYDSRYYSELVRREQYDVDGQVVRSATGQNGPGLDWTSWDLRELQGKQAQVQLVDNPRGQRGARGAGAPVRCAARRPGEGAVEAAHRRAPPRGAWALTRGVGADRLAP